MFHCLRIIKGKKFTSMAKNYSYEAKNYLLNYHMNVKNRHCFRNNVNFKKKISKLTIFVIVCLETKLILLIGDNFLQNFKIYQCSLKMKIFYTYISGTKRLFAVVKKGLPHTPER